ncbi:DUF5691 domain-containing protein [Stigmatella aurantiaca]|uniref:Conserved uncharacterized protein n=1 Tax=Stigmatella aurantiaca (strain DW4/3-1) TaxID=378806 RepID=E3FVH3_STIAD|nr:DUF5691 domain-containing protein [Stigmatella aurantiaca]ADO70999.1 conserved uncharacterized protein [Stigmatella aurantiaca DW4/3-1]
MSELDALTRLATLGTARAPDPGTLEGVAAQAFHALEGLSPEKRLLLAAGVRAVAQAAGHPLSRRAPPEEAAPADTLEVCPPRVIALLTELLVAQDAEVLRECFGRMAQARRRLPPELLPRVLSLQEPSLRLAAEPVLGERGRWLSQINPTWRSFSPSAAHPSEAERLWTEGTLEERRTVLAATRLTHPAQARAWLEGTFPQEKAEHRARFLACFEQGLSAEDEPLLELGRKDRSAGVREVARGLLAQLPGSAFTQRMMERARAVLLWEPRSGLHIQFPSRWDAEAERDGLDKPPPGLGQHAHWLVRLLACVPPSSWEAWFAASPAQLVAAAGKTDEGVALSEGWAQALRLGASSDWAAALLSFWPRLDSKVLEPERAQSLAITVFGHLPLAERASRTLRILQGEDALPSLERALALTPAPWPVELGRAWLQALRAQDVSNPRALALFGSLRHAALALPFECLEAASEPFESASPLLQGHPALQRFQQTVSQRRILHQELTP